MDQEELNMYPRPKDPSILHLQATHRSSIVWEVGGADNQRSRHRDPNNASFPPLHPRIVPILRALRFDGVSRLSRIQIDWSLITALVERWRSETHTFHLPFGECMISLEDVSVLLGLRIDGPAVIGFTSVDGGWDNYISHVLGVRPGKEGLVGGRVKCTWLNKEFPSLPNDASDLQLQRYTQAYLLQLIGGVLFTDHSGGQVHCMYIPLIKDLDSCAKLSWGSAVLAFLYRELCKSCKKDKEENAGCLILLQLWAWSRLPTLAPIPRGPPLNNALIWGDLPGPHGLRWSSSLSFTDSGSHTLAHSRLSLDVMVDSQFRWQPYTHDILSNLSEHCREGSNIWYYKGPLICFYIVEPHNPDRCLRQFGMVQSIPSPCIYSHDLHKLDLKGKTDINWIVMHHEHLDHWNSREQHVVVADVGAGVSDEYHNWFSSITLPYLTRIGGGHTYTMNLLDLVDSIYKGEKSGDLLAITARARHVLQEKFSLGYYQDFPVEDRRAKENELKGKSKRGGKRGGNIPRIRGKLPNISLVDEGVNLGNEGDVDLEDEENVHFSDEGVHLDGEGGIPIADKFMCMQEKEVGCSDVDFDARERALCPRWNLLSSNESLLSSPPDEHDVDPTNPVHQPITHQPLHQPVQKLPVQRQPAQQQAAQQHPAQELPVQCQPAQHQVTQHHPFEQQKRTAQQQQSTQQQQVQPAQAAQQVQQPVQREHAMQLRNHKHFERDCGTDGKKEIRPYKRRHLVKKYQ